MKENILVRLEDIATKIGSGATPKGGKNAYKNNGITLIRSLNVYDFKFEIDGLAFIDESQAQQLKNVIVEENDILLNITGASVARCCIVPKKLLPARVNQHVSIIRIDSKKAVPQYILYCINTHKYKHHLLTLAQKGATREALTKEMICDFQIPLPPLQTQRKIAGILSAYDDLIENNTRRIEILEEMARMLYREWFVKFRFPVEDRGNGGEDIGDDRPSNDRPSNDRPSNDRPSNDRPSNDRPSNDRTSNDRTSNDRTSNDRTSNDRTSNDRTSNDRTSNDRPSNDRTSNDRTSNDRTSNDRPSNDRTSNDRTSNDRTHSPELVESELGLIPKGWEVVTLKDCIKLTHGYTFKSSQFSTEPTPYVVIRMGNITENGGLQVEKNIKYVEHDSFKEKYLLKPNDLVMAFSDVTRTGGIIGNVALIPNDENQYVLNQRVVKIDVPENLKMFFYIYFNSQTFKDHCLSRADSATVLNLKNDHIYDHQVLIPSQSILSRFIENITQIVKQIQNLEKKNINLRKTRDLLLPRLISGEIDVEDLDINLGKNDP